ncbi:peptidoglycan/LPS O-acetylase OafA/YrhL [Bradyrhizobium japonicum]|uniref:acyltransferase family protein n=1 Tax=Bradyrhizobium japonicum TaxID=375 RepID=UPI002167889A|nr:acyltransferase [Bradyrhizobium japonicum]MCS3501741.1 peptidoglycan/LPS O-acetylase OafA/YrhL [Bradyrhizobium japonicum]MCS3965545.1 peptidoglycan/LPS O-acetylase OafA/YrhL [Bradyrhizobium japonicum]MCS3997852.1 peptidoglycan/LPS O-acetylase OafA/YrhL [Bradyrhizobium japonicum]
MMVKAWKLPALRVASDEMLHLDLLRFIASVGIVVRHSFEFFYPAATRPTLPSGLALFVDLFFVISGFVIAHVYLGKVGTLSEYGTFLQRRVGRLMPLHWLTLAASIIVWSGFVALGKAGNHQPSFEARCIAETALLLNAMLVCGNGISFSSVSWSIGAEMVMYLMFPLFAWAAVRSRLGLLATASLALVAMIVFDLSQNAIDRSWVDVWPPFRALPSFMIGICLFYFRDGIQIPAPGRMLLLAKTLLLISMITHTHHLISLGLVYIVAVTAVAADRAVAPALVKRLAPLGQLTYSIYMWHSLVILIVMNAIADKLFQVSPGVMVVFCMVSWLIIFAVSYFSYFVIETPARRYIDGLGGAKKRRVTAVVVSKNERLGGQTS